MWWRGKKEGRVGGRDTEEEREKEQMSRKQTFEKVGSGFRRGQRGVAVN